MKRVAIVVEGDTEEEFVKQVLRPHLEAHGVTTEAMKPSGQGGNISVDRLAPVMAKLSWNFDAVTSLVDFYGFKGKLSGESVTDLEARIDASVQTAQPSDLVTRFPSSRTSSGTSSRRCCSRFRLHSTSFRACLPRLWSALGQVAQEFATPEDINDDRNTAPSKRIVLAVPNFRKRLHGPAIAEGDRSRSNPRRLPPFPRLGEPA